MPIIPRLGEQVEVDLQLGAIVPQQAPAPFQLGQRQLVTEFSAGVGAQTDVEKAVPHVTFIDKRVVAVLGVVGRQGKVSNPMVKSV